VARRTTYPGRRNIGVLLPGEMWDALQDAAYARDMSRNLLMTVILRDWLAENVNKFACCDPRYPTCSHRMKVPA